MAFRPFLQGAVVASATATAASLFVQNKRGTVAQASEALHPPSLPWGFQSFFKSYDMAAVRRGHVVFTKVCSSCHSIEQLAYRNLVGNIYTEEEAKAMAAEVEVEDEPDDQGRPRTRPGKLSDHIPGPYKNAQEARNSNAGALPPDLSLIIKARHAGPDYVFALLTGYRNKPEGVTIGDALHYNPYFPGGGIAMAQSLFEDVVEYDDGTKGTPAQYAKDVVEFLAWVAEPEAEQRKRMGLKFMLLMALTAIPAFYYKRFKFSLIKHRVVKFVKPQNFK